MSFSNGVIGSSSGIQQIGEELRGCTFLQIKYGFRIFYSITSKLLNMLFVRIC